MRERSVLFTKENRDKVRNGTKTMTRRVIKPQPGEEDVSIIERSYDWTFDTHGFLWGLVAGDMGYDNTSLKPPYQVGDQIYLKETFWAWGHWVKNGISKTGKQKWECTLFNSRVVGLTVSDKIIYCYDSRITENYAYEGYIYAINRATGKIIWKYNASHYYRKE